MPIVTTVKLYKFHEISELPTAEAQRRAMETLSLAYSQKGPPSRILRDISNIQFTETGYEYE